MKNLKRKTVLLVVIFIISILIIGSYKILSKKSNVEPVESVKQKVVTYFITKV